MIRALTPETDTAALRDLFARAADYVMLETGQPPGDSQITGFFTGAPPGIDPATSLRLGMFLPGGQLVAIADLAFGYPNPDDAYIGLLLIDPNHRGKRLGQQMLGHVFASASTRKARRILIAVLEDNPKAQRFWQKMGFVEDLRGPPTQMGSKTHVQIRMTMQL
jgi:ribosomal protein S18 acetylase RimI-like enzyme